VADMEAAAAEFRILARNLKAAGEGGLRRQVQKQITEAAKPLAREIASPEHLKPYMPDRYALVLSADLTVRVARGLSSNPGVQIRAQAREHKRKVARLDTGLINHPVYAQGARRGWSWSNNQTGGMKAGFFTDPCQRATPQIRSKVLQALTEVAGDVTRKA
jgi:hypothetical protein